MKKAPVWPAGVSVMFGKRAASATPTWALAEWTLASAALMSGR